MKPLPNQLEIPTICGDGKPNDIISIPYMRSDVVEIIRLLKSPFPNPDALRRIARGFEEQLAGGE